MKLGIHLGIFRRNSLEELLDAAAAHGLQSIHFNFKVLGMPSMPEQLDPATCRQVVRLAAERGLEIASVSGTFNMIHPNVQTRREGLRRLETIVRAARSMNVPVVALCTGTRHPDDMWRDHPDNQSPRAWADLLDSMATALAIAERHGVVLGIEPEVANVVDSAGKARALLDHFASPQLGVIIDAANLLRPESLDHMSQVLDEAFELLGSHLVLAHAKEIDHAGRAGKAPPGRGMLDWKRYFRLLAGCGFQGSIIMHSLAEADVPASVRFLRRLLDEVQQ